jgi:hypothetical protein
VSGAGTPAVTTGARVAAWGFAIAGRVERPHCRDPRLVYRAFWIDRAG